MYNKQILFRADGNYTIGLGHLYRLFALVEMFKDEFECVFLTRKNSILKVIPTGYNVKTIPNNITLESEANWVSNNFNTEDCIIIADGYQFVSSYQKAIKEKGFFLIYIDDLTIEHMYANIVINHSPYLKEDDFTSEPYTQFALGTDYAMLRPKFLEAAKKDRVIDKIDTVFICFGGVDLYDLSYKSTKAIIEIEEIIEVNVVLGGVYSHGPIFELAKKNSKVKLYRNLDETSLYKLMCRCNLGIVPSSTISYEVCSVKMMILGGYNVCNQVKIYEGFKENGVIYEAGDFTKLSELDFRIETLKIIEDSKDNYLYFMNQQKLLFDGEQKKRFLSLIEK